MPDHATIYETEALAYDRLVTAEDCDGALPAALGALCPPEGARVLDVGVGTGRIARALVAAGATVVGVDRARPMLRVGRPLLAALDVGRSVLVQADARALPVADGWADLAVAGWVFGHFRRWMPDGWRVEVGRALDGMARALRPGGVLVVVETLGTGREDPFPPTDGLAEYYAWLEREQGFARRVLRTDYLFADVERAVESCGFFFGAELAARIRDEQLVRVPECTGLWWRQSL